MLQRILAVLALLGAFWLASASDGQEKPDKLDEQAKAVSEQFHKSLFKKDVDGLMKLVAVPFLIKGRDGQVFDTLADVKKEFAKFMEDGGKEPSKPTFTFKVISYEQFQSKGASAEERKEFDKVLKKSDRVVVVRVKEEGDPSNGGPGFGMLVTWREGQARVVGMVIPVSPKPPKKNK